jgi:hypothetical protein
MIFTDRNYCYCSISITIWFNLWSSVGGGDDDYYDYDYDGGGDHYHFLNIVLFWGLNILLINKYITGLNIT